MNHTDHERAHQLLAASAIEGITSTERAWLESHLASCDPCSTEAAAMASALRSLRTLPVVAGSDLVRRTKLAVEARAEELAAEQNRSAPLWIAVAMCSIWMIATTPYVWRTFAWLGEIAHIPVAAWQVGFLMWWFLPATALAAVAAWRHVATNDAPYWAPDWSIDADWRRQ